MQKQQQEASQNPAQEANHIYIHMGKDDKPPNILSIIISVIIAPLILWAIENFFTSHKWPLVIQINTNYQPIFITWFIISSIGTYILILCMLYRITNPYECTCGYKTWSGRKMLRHSSFQHRDQKNYNYEDN